MTGVSALRGENARAFVKRLHRRRSDRQLMRLMAQQAQLINAIDKSRQRAGVPVKKFAIAAGIDDSTYRRIMSGAVLMRATTIAKLRRAQRQAAAGAIA